MLDVFVGFASCWAKLMFGSCILRTRNFVLVFARRCRVYCLVGVVEGRLPFFLTSNHRSDQVCCVFSSDRPSVVKRNECPVPGLNRRLPSHNEPCLVPIGPTVAEYSGQVGIMLTF